MGRVCVVGSFMMDLVVRTSRRPALGETVVGDSLEYFLGGKGFNQAIAAARSGAAVSMVGRLGADAFGDRFAAVLEAEGIDTAHVGRDGKAGTGTAFPVVDDNGDNSIIIVPQANLAMTIEDIDAAKAEIERADVVLAQLELPFEVVRRAFEVARGAGATTILNPAPMSGDLQPFRGLVDIVTPNETEAAAISGATLEDPVAVAAAVAEALDTPSVLLTLGEHGCLLWNEGRVRAHDAHDVVAVDTVGAGDATCGALAAALAGGASLEEAVVRGNAAGALAVTVPGAEPSMPTGAAIEGLLAGTGVSA